MGSLNEIRPLWRAAFEVVLHAKGQGYRVGRPQRVVVVVVFVVVVVV
jgi:hypothetical protein